MSRLVPSFVPFLMLMTGIGCGPAASTDSQKNLQARINLVSCLGEINQLEKVTKSSLESVNAYVEKAVVDETIKQQLLRQSEELWKQRKSAAAIDSITREMSGLVPLPEKYAKAYGF